jgi:very-short-patch-repair endonuclease
LIKGYRLKDLKRQYFPKISVFGILRPRIAVILPLTQDACVNCCEGINARVAVYSKKIFDMQLCEPCQQDFVRRCRSATKREIVLYKGLVKAGVAAKLQKYDRYKTVDIVVPEAMVHIEVDGSHHNTKADQALSDIRRTYHSLKEGYITLRIPNSLMNHHFEEALRYIIGILAIRREQIKSSSGIYIQTFTANRKVR